MKIKKEIKRACLSIQSFYGAVINLLNSNKQFQLGNPLIAQMYRV